MAVKFRSKTHRMPKVKDRELIHQTSKTVNSYHEILNIDYVVMLTSSVGHLLYKISYGQCMYMVSSYIEISDMEE